MFRNGCDRFLHLERFRQMCIPSGGQTFLRIFFIRQRIFPIPHITNPFLHLNVYLIYFTMLGMPGRQPYCLQHILNENPISSGTVLHENIGDGPTRFTVLDDRCTAHSLDDSCRSQGDQVRICDFQFGFPGSRSS